MKKNLYSAGLLLALLTHILLFPDPTLHICTVASHADIGLEYLKKSCTRLNLDLTILGWGEPYDGNITKLLHVQKHLATLPKEDIVLFIDAFDSIILADTKEIVEKFYSAHAPFIISAESYRGCHGIPELAIKNTPYPTIFRCINSGGYIGYVWAIRKILDDLPYNKVPNNWVYRPGKPRDWINKSDQMTITYHFLSHPELYTIDHYCSLFLNLHRLSEKDFAFNNEISRVDSLHTHSYPCVVQGNGPDGRVLLKKLWNQIFS